MKGTATAPGAATVINAIATLKGSAFAIDLRTRATVELEEGESGVEGSTDVDVDTTLIETCVENTLDSIGVEAGGRVETETEIPPESGLKSSSAAANASVLATLDALDAEDALEPLEATLVGVESAREAGVTITGALDDATASMLGGVVLTDNSKDELLRREEYDAHVAVYVPDERAESASTDVERSKLVAPVVERAFDMARDGDYADAMTTNGFAYCAALRRDASPAVDALAHAEGAGLSGTGPSFAAIGNSQQVSEVAKEWKGLEGKVLELKTDNEGAI
ncbi:MAG: shikimate kinase [Halobacteriales archaeon]|nr:shikimate kinase [Halobacteriales archaeon]